MVERMTSSRISGLGLLVGVWLLGCTPKLEPPPREAAQPVPVEAKERGVMWQESFDRPDVASLGWGSPSDASPEEIEAVFDIEADDIGKFLHARHEVGGQDDPPPAVHFGRAWKKDAMALSEVCHLSWRWRVRHHPAAHEDPWLDLGASVYVIIELPGLLSSGKGFKLGWLQKPGPTDETQKGIVQVQQRVDPATGTWHEEKVDLCALYREHYGGDPSEVPLLYVGVVTDADNTESLAEADYDELTLSSKP
jgi:hypothetical protein